MKRIFSKVIFPAAVVALIYLLSGCDADFSFCVYDTDCLEDRLCIAATCEAMCVGDEDCLGGTSCEAYQRTGEASPVQVCLPPQSAPEGEPVQCEDDQICRELLNDPDAYCGIHQRCLRPGESDDNLNGAGDGQQGSPNGGGEATAPTYSILILEQLAPQDSGEDDLGGDDDEPGEVDSDDADGDEEADLEQEDGPDDGDPSEEQDSPQLPRPLRIGAVIARNTEGAARAYGEVLYMGGHDDSYGALSEAPLVLDEEQICLAEPEEAAYVSLGGPGGYVAIRFRTGAGESASLEPSWRLEIIADGPRCLLGSADEDADDQPFGEYRALFCVSDSQELDREDDCPLQFAGPFTGPSTLEVAEP